MTPTSYQAQLLFDTLKERNEKIVFAESCTAGRVASLFAEIPGASNYLIGSFVTYRASQKTAVLKVSKATIEGYTAESSQVVMDMATNALALSPEATWAAAIVGDLGPNVSDEKDGRIYVYVIGRSSDCKLQTHVLSKGSRVDRMRDAALYVFECVIDLIGD